VNICHLLGKVVANPTLESTSQGNKVCRFRLATYNGKGRIPTKHNIVVLGKSSTDEHPLNVYKFAQRGSKLQVTGFITESRWQPKDSTEWRAKTEIISTSVEFIAKAEAQQESQPVEVQEGELSALPE
jgi:single-stranded DNA-binding protein